MGMTGRDSGSPIRSAGSRTAGGPAVPGVIETIANGLSLILVFPALIAVPLVVDAATWAGLGISPRSLAERSRSLADALDGLGIEDNLARLFGLFVPSLLSWVERERLFTLGDGPSVAPNSWWPIALALVGVLLIGALIHAAFRVPLAFVIRRQPMDGASVARAVGVVWLRLIGFAALVVGAFALLLLPVAVTGVLLYALGVDATPLIVIAVLVPVGLAVVCLYFAPAAIAVSDVGPFRACYLSFNVVRRNLWPVLGLIGSIALISSGLPVLWLSRADHPIGLLIGVFCNALVSTGLVLASMQFYFDRLGRWQSTLAGSIPSAARG
jgi:hypothetical protein